MVRKSYCDTLGLDNVRTPLCFVHISVALDQVDVNIDPNKTRVMLHNQVLIEVSVFTDVSGSLTFLVISEVKAIHFAPQISFNTIASRGYSIKNAGGGLH